MITVSGGCSTFYSFLKCNRLQSLKCIYNYSPWNVIHWNILHIVVKVIEMTFGGKNAAVNPAIHRIYISLYLKHFKEQNKE